ncbi:MAG: sulfur carrier protein ThiS [Perlucidibaca sp.]
MSLAAGTTLADLVTRQGLAGRRIAVEHNGEIVPRSRHASCLLADGDTLEIVHAIGGG